MFDPAAVLTSADFDRTGDAAARPDTLDSLCAETPRLRRLVHRLLGWSRHGSDLDDIVQESLLAAWRQRDSFRGEASLTTWLTRITIRKVQDHVRATRRRRLLFGFLMAEEELPPASAPAADAPLDAHDDTHRAMRRLPHADREVLVLRYLEQREIPTIAELLGCSRAAVDARLTRARERLRRVLVVVPSKDEGQP